VRPDQEDDAQMNRLQQADRPAADQSLRETAQGDLDAGGVLGFALGLRAEECCDLCYSRASAYPWAGHPPDPTYTERSRGVNWLATVLTARWIAYRAPVSAEEIAISPTAVIWPLPYSNRR